MKPTFIISIYKGYVVKIICVNIKFVLQVLHFDSFLFQTQIKNHGDNSSTQRWRRRSLLYLWVIRPRLRISAASSLRRIDDNLQNSGHDDGPQEKTGWLGLLRFYDEYRILRHMFDHN